MLETHYRFKTHAQIVATTQAGKSKLVEFLCRCHHLNDCQVFGIDGKGTTYRGMGNYYARITPKRKCIFIDPAGKKTIPFRFFNPQGANPGSHASRAAKVILNALGTEQIQDVRRYRMVVNMICSYCALSGESIVKAVDMLYFHNKVSILSAIDICTGQMRDEWMDLYATKSQSEWNTKTESTRNRLSAFVSIEPLRRMFGYGDGIDIQEELRGGANIWVNLCPSDPFPEEACRIVGGFLTSELKDFSLANTRKIYAYLDEAELYASPDLASLLELSAGSGIRCTLIHHHAAQFPDPRTQRDIEKLCRIKFIGAGTTPEEAERLARQAHFGDINRRRKKDDRIAFVNRYELEEYSTFTESEHGVSVSHGTRRYPIPEQVSAGQEDWTYQEKVAMESERYLALKNREFRVITPEYDRKLVVPFLCDYWTNTEKILQFMERHAIPNEDIDRAFDCEPKRKLKKPPQAGA